MELADSSTWVSNDIDYTISYLERITNGTLNNF